MVAATQMQRAEVLLAHEEGWARRALRRASLAWWTASITGQAGDYQRMESAERAVNRHYARPQTYQRLVRLADGPDLDALTRRRLQRLRKRYWSKQAPVEMLDRITRAESAVQETYSTFRAQFDGHSATDNELEEVLRTARESPRLQTAWEARKQIGPVVADDLRRLAHLRNDAARAIGFADFWQAQLLAKPIARAASLRARDRFRRLLAGPVVARRARSRKVARDPGVGRRLDTGALPGDEARSRSASRHAVQRGRARVAPLALQRSVLSGNAGGLRAASRSVVCRARRRRDCRRDLPGARLSDHRQHPEPQRPLSARGKEPARLRGRHRS